MNPDRSEVSAWLVRAEQARRIAGMLVGDDAEVAQAYAKECEARARALLDRWHVAPIAA